MATQRGGSWQGVVYHPNLPGGRARRSFGSKKEAEAWEVNTRAAAQNGTPVDMGDTKGAVARRAGVPYTMKELADYCIRTHWKGKASEDKASYNALQVAEIIGNNFPVSRLTRTEVDRLKVTLADLGNSKATINRKLAALSKMQNIALDLDIVKRAVRLERQKEAEHRIRRFTPAEEAMARAFFERIGHPDMADLVEVLVDTGMRTGEALAITQENLVHGKVQIWGTEAKSGRSRTVPLTARAKGILEARKGGRNVRLFATIDRHSLRNRWDQFRAALELEDDPHFVPHILRHEFCSRLADLGSSAPVIKDLAGHASLVVTQRYIHITGDSLAAAIAGLETARANSPRAMEVA